MRPNATRTLAPFRTCLSNFCIPASRVNEVARRTQKKISEKIGWREIVDRPSLHFSGILASVDLDEFRVLNVSIPRRQFNSIYVTAPSSVKKRIELRNEGWKGSEIKINTISKWSVFMEIIIKLYTYVVIYSTEIRQRSNIYIYISQLWSSYKGGEDDTSTLSRFGAPLCECRITGIPKTSSPYIVSYFYRLIFKYTWNVKWIAKR